MNLRVIGVIAAIVLLGLAPRVGAQSSSVKIDVESVGPMRWARTAHCGTRLPDGRVLITGGSLLGREVPLPWAEVFDPVTRTFESTGAMNVPRFDHVAVLLRDGNVLVAGGWRAGYVEPTDTAEIWDAKSGTFTLVGSLTLARGAGMAVARISDDEVILIGGTKEGDYGMATDVIDVFSERTRTFTRWGTLTMARSDAVVHVLDGQRVLVSGGGFRCCSHPANSLRTRGQEVLDLATRQAHATNDLPGGGVVGGEAAVTLPSGRTLVAGHGTGLPVLAFDGSWHRLPRSQEALLMDHSLVTAFTEDLLVAAEHGFIVLDLLHGEAIPAPGPSWYGAPTMTWLGEGRVLATGGQTSNLRARPSAWVLTVRR